MANEIKMSLSEKIGSIEDNTKMIPVKDVKEFIKEIKIAIMPTCAVINDKRIIGVIDKLAGENLIK